MWPVIIRELRAGSRRWTTYWLRLIAAGTVVAAITWWLSSPGSMLVRQPGREVFLQMHRVILAAIWIMAPLMASDCLSREKREGTLGLLFLTNLRAWNIVFAKAAAVGLTALGLWLAVIPIITVPILLGGLPATEIAFSCSLALSSLLGALAAGLLASALCSRSSGAVALAIIFSSIGHLAFVVLVGEVQYRLTSGGSFLQTCSSEFGPDLHSLYMVWNLYSPSFRGGWGMMARGVPAAMNASVFLIPLFSMLMAVTIALLAAVIIRRNWQDKPKTKRQTDTEKFFCSPVFMTGLFHRWMRRSIERNPIGWLEKRSWTGRITAWIWLAVMISFASALAYGAGRDALEGFNILMFMLLGSMAYVAAGSFRRERETGALELILVTPLSERHIIFGRLRALWSQFLPTFLLWVAVVLFLSTALHDWQFSNVLRFAALYLVVPVVGLYFSLRSRFVLLAWIATLTVCFTVCFALPQLLSWVVSLLLADWFNDLLPGISPDGLVIRVVRWGFENVSWFTVLALQVTLATVLLWRLRVNLVRRTFSFR